MKTIAKIGIGIVASAVLLGAFGLMVITDQTAPMPIGKDQFIRFDTKTSRMQAFRQLAKIGVVKNAQALELIAKTSGQPSQFRRGTYTVRPGMNLQELVKALEKPVRTSVRLPEGYWIARTAFVLQEAEICSASEYIDLSTKPDEFRKEFPFIPAGLKSLEGFLYPDTYFFTPKLGAREVIREQLGTFRKKALPKVGDPKKLLETLNIAAMVDLETAAESERAIVSGVIHNRLRIKMPLQIDATVLYALQEWKELGPGVVNTIDSPYNTYRIPGLPPGPIASPTDKSIDAAANPTVHNYLYYMAKPDKTHFFASTYSQHLNNINKARAMK